MQWLVGVDEAGRGPLAGPVSVATFAIPHKTPLYPQGSLVGVRDSKRLSEKQREIWYEKFVELRLHGEVMFTCSLVSASVIDEKGIVVAIRLGIARSLAKLALDPENCVVLLDGSLKAPPEYKYQKTIIHGDDIEPIISAASIVAKVTRDCLMIKLAKKYPGYSLEVHKGYGTKRHYAAIQKLGPSPIHRLSFL